MTIKWAPVKVESMPRMSSTDTEVNAAHTSAYPSLATPATELLLAIADSQ